jgi:hypothetical protein
MDHTHAAATGRHAGARAALHARGRSAAAVDAGQLEREKARAYAPLAQRTDGPDRKDLNAATARVMRNYCAEPKNAERRLIGEFSDTAKRSSGETCWDKLPDPVSMPSSGR